MILNWPWFFGILTVWTSVSIRPVILDSCVPPNITIDIDFNQIAGVWHHQMFAFDDQLSFDYVCDRMEYILTSNNSGLAVSSFYHQASGNFSLTTYKLTRLQSGIIHSVGITSPISAYLYPLLITNRSLVFSLCMTTNGQLVNFNALILTKSKTADRKYLRGLLVKANVTYNHAHFFENFEDCYTLNCLT